MKRTPFYKQSRLIMNVFLLTFVIISCTKKTNDLKQAANLEEIATASPEKKSGTSTEVRLKLTVNDAAGNNITSDIGQDYVDGQQNSSIYFSTSGNLQFSTAASSNPNTPVTRWLNANFGSPLTGSLPRGIEKSSFMSSLTGSGPDATLIQNLAIGATKCITLAVGLMTVSGGVLNFHNRNEDFPNTTNTSYVYVTRLNSTIDGHAQWLMAPAPPSGFSGCSAISNVGALRISTVWNGDYNMPFSFTLTKL